MYQVKEWFKSVQDLSSELSEEYIDEKFDMMFTENLDLENYMALLKRLSIDMQKSITTLE